MQLRRFTAESTPAALGAVRQALGEDALILANRRIGDKVEIIATGQIDDVAMLAQMSADDLVESAKEQETVPTDFQDTATLLQQRIEQSVSPSVSTQTPEAGQAAVAERAPRAFVPETVSRAAVAERAPSAAVAESPPRPQSADSPQPSAEPAGELKEDIVNISALSQAINSESNDQPPLGQLGSYPAPMGAPVELSAASHASHPAASRVMSSDQEERLSANVADQLKRAMQEQNDMISDRFRALEVNLWGSNAPNRTAHLQQIFAIGIGAELAIRLVERASPETPVEDALRQSFALLKSTLPIGKDKTLSVPGVTIMSGAPGSGKTTAVVKLATEHVKQSGNQSIVIICADTRRIGAFEELQAYGRLLGVPTVHAHDTSELDSLIQAFTHKELVLIDHTLPEEQDSVVLPECLLNPTDENTVRHLFALAATMQSATADALIERHCAGRSMQCVLTHLDTNARLGELFNSIIRHHLPIAYWSDAASVQRPLQRADASVLVATAVAMSRRIQPSPDDQWLQRLIQPTQSLLSGSPMMSGTTSLYAS